jgi:IS605 OrfB family transposase
MNITVRLPLQVSNRKAEKIDKLIERQEELADFFSTHIHSYEEYKWGGRPNKSMRRLPRGEYGDLGKNGLASSHYRNSLFRHISDIYANWRDDGYPGEEPDFSEIGYAILCSCGSPKEDSINRKSCELTFEKNEGDWGVQIPLLDEEDDKDWFRLRTGGYQEKLLEEADNIGSTPRIVKKNGRYELHQSLVFEDKDMDYEAETFVGVDMGLNKVATVVVVQNGEVEQVEFFDGAEIRHYREKMGEQRRELQAAGRQDKVEEIKNLEEKFCNQQNHTFAKRIVGIADEYENPVIKMESLSGIRDTINEREYYRSSRRFLNRWAFGQLQEYINYKAERRGIKTSEVNPKNTSKDCYKCGETVTRPYKENQELCYCRECEEERNADMNGAANIATR